MAGRQNRIMKRAWIWAMTAIVGLASLMAVYGWLSYRSFLEQPLQISSPTTVLVERGSTVRSVIAELSLRDITTAGWHWRLLTRLEPVTIQAGEYALESGLRPQALMSLLASGEVIKYNFTIIEGWRFSELVEALAQDPVIRKTLDGHDDPAIQALFGMPEPPVHPEGWFLPETYQYVRGDSDLQILGRAHAAMKTALSESWESRDDELPLGGPYDMLILASIVEKESALESERPDIAGVFIRRLQQRWRLETDPTVIYGLGDAWDGDIKRRDLNTDTPYNTYTRYGLTPTPIALPGKNALEAVAHPADGTAMFFVASGTGGHVFSETLEQHNKAVREMLKRTP